MSQVKVLNTAELSTKLINSYIQQSPLKVADQLTLVDVVPAMYGDTEYFNFVFEVNGFERKISAGVLTRKHANMPNFDDIYNNKFYSAIDKLVKDDNLSVKTLAELINGKTLTVVAIEKLPDSEGRKKSFIAFDLA